MRKIKLIVLLGVTLGLLTFGWNMPGIALAEPQTNCPVMDGKIDEKFFADYKGKRIYFCCAGCIERIQKRPGKVPEENGGAGVTPAKRLKPNSFNSSIFDLFRWAAHPTTARPLIADIPAQRDRESKLPVSGNGPLL